MDDTSHDFLGALFSAAYEEPDDPDRESDRPKPDRRPLGSCDECGKRARLNPIYASHSADVTQRLCDECKAKRQAALEAMWRGE